MYTEKIKALEVLQKSDTFKTQALLIELLKYLIEQDEKGVKLKSIVIAIDLLSDSKASSSDRDRLIRTRVYNLRKKMELFYLTEGKDETCKLLIPKGAYSVTLVKKKVPSQNSDWLSKPTVIFASLSLVLIGVIIFVLFRKEKELDIQTNSSDIFTEIKQHFFVQSLLTSNSSSLDIVIGEREYYYEYDTALVRHRFVLDGDYALPHTESRFKELQDSYPDRKIQKAGFSHVDPHNVFLGMKLHYSLLQQGIQSQYGLSNHISSVEKNILFIGSLGQGDLNKLLPTYFFSNKFSKITAGMKGENRAIHIKEQGKKNSYIWGDQNIITYYLIRKSVFEGHHYLFLFSGGEMSRDYMIKKMFTNAFSEEMKSHFDTKIPDNYEIVIAVHGFKGVGVSHEVLFAKAIELSLIHI